MEKTVVCTLQLSVTVSRYKPAVVTKARSFPLNLKISSKHRQTNAEHLSHYAEGARVSRGDAFSPC